MPNMVHFGRECECRALASFRALESAADNAASVQQASRDSDFAPSEEEGEQGCDSWSEDDDDDDDDEELVSFDERFCHVRICILHKVRAMRGLCCFEHLEMFAQSPGVHLAARASWSYVQ